MASSDASSSTVYRSDSAATSDSQQTAATTASYRSALSTLSRLLLIPSTAQQAAQQPRAGGGAEAARLPVHGLGWHLSPPNKPAWACFCMVHACMQNHAEKPSSSTCWAHAPCAMRQGHIGLQPRRRRRGRQQRCLGWIWRERACPSRILQRSPHSASCRATTCTTGCMGRALLPMKARR